MSSKLNDRFWPILLKKSTSVRIPRQKNIRLRLKSSFYADGLGCRKNQWNITLQAASW